MVNYIRKYSCSFVYEGKIDLYTITKINISSIIKHLIENYNVTNFYFSNFNPLEKFVYFVINDRKKENHNIKTINLVDINNKKLKDLTQFIVFLDDIQDEISTFENMN